jgi:osmotically-inducible protein OsmY
MALAACDRNDGTTVGQKVDGAMAEAKVAAANVKQTAERGVEHAAQISKEKSAEMAHTVNDAAITAAINAGLAKDKELSALRINVDTKDGRVALYGSAPNEAAKQRAQQIAQAEKGVTGVDNKLAVESRTGS